MMKSLPIPSLFLLTIYEAAAYKLTNYGEILREIPLGRNLYDVEYAERTNDNVVRRKTVKELLKMNEDYLDYMGYNSHNTLNPYKPDKLTDVGVEYDNIDIYHGNSNFETDSVEDLLENMLGRDFFDDKKFILFLIFSLIVMILILCWCFIGIQWCCRTQGCCSLQRNTNKRSSLISTPNPSSPRYKQIAIPISYSSDAPMDLYSDLNSSYPDDDAFLQGKKLYPGVL